MSDTLSENYSKLNKRYQEIKNQLADLEAKLAESEKQFIVANNLRKNSDEVLLNYKTEKYGLDKTIQELRKMKLSLPEKEWYYKGFENCERQMSSHIADLTLEVKELKQQLAEKDKEIEEVKKSKTYIMNFGSKVKEVQVVDDNQDKISFAIAELEKVKDYAQHIQGGLINFINNQIEELKKEMKQDGLF